MKKSTDESDTSSARPRGKLKPRASVDTVPSGDRLRVVMACARARQRKRSRRAGGIGRAVVDAAAAAAQGGANADPNDDAAARSYGECKWGVLEAASAEPVDFFCRALSTLHLRAF